METYKIAVIPGDGIGPEVIREGQKVLSAIGQIDGIQFEWQQHELGAERYLTTGHILSDADMDDIGKADAVYLGALGDPRVPERILQAGILLRMRFEFDQYINLRPIKLIRGVDTPLKGKGPSDINFVVIRENSEDFYIGLGGRFQGRTHQESLKLTRRLYHANIDVGFDVDTDVDLAYQVGAMTAVGVQRVARYGFELARKRGWTRVTAVDKQNVLGEIYGLWRESIEKVASDYPEIELSFSYVDAITMWFVRRPETYQVVIAPNMFGDIITDLGAALAGGMGVAPGGNINPDGGVSMFEPIHGSAPRYAGQNVTNPIATILAGAMMLDHLGKPESAARIERAVEGVLAAGQVRTYDLGGKSTCSEVGDAIVERLEAGE